MKIIKIVLFFGYIFLLAPILLLILNAFGESEVPGIWNGLTLKWFKAAFGDKDLLRAALISAEVAVLSATGATIFGVMAAIYTSKKEPFLGRLFLKNILIFPIVVPEILIGFALLLLFFSLEQFISIPRGLVTICIGHIIASVAYVHMNVRSKILNLDPAIEEAALNLGARPKTVFWHIKLPMLRSTIIASWVLAFTLSLDDLVIASFLTGPGATTLPILIFSNIRVGITPVVNAFATIFILLVIASILLAKKLSKRPDALDDMII